MGSTEIINRTSRALDMKVGNCRYFVDMATVESNQSYTVHVNSSDTYMEFCLGISDAAGEPILVNSDECVDNRRIIAHESVDGRFHVEMEPRNSSVSGTDTVCEPRKHSKRRYTFWRLWIF